MTDVFTKSKRSEVMSRIKGCNTKPELAVRSLLHRMGYRFRLHRADLPGKPDIVLSRYKTVIFVHGCFWHRHKDCRFAYTPKSRTEFWMKKLESNVIRDIQVKSGLELLGWRVITVWECELREPEQLYSRFKTSLKRHYVVARP
jgi:DNA mismatch endonuclease (patch repair protein)